MENSFQDSGSTHSQLIGTKFLRSWNSSEPKCLSRHICMELRSLICVSSCLSICWYHQPVCVSVCLLQWLCLSWPHQHRHWVSLPLFLYVHMSVCLCVCLYICLTVSSVWSLSVLYLIVVCVSFYPEQWLDGVCPSCCPPALSSPPSWLSRPLRLLEDI